MEDSELGDDRPQESDEWAFEVAQGYRVQGFRSGETLLAELMVDFEAETLRFRVTRCDQSVVPPGMGGPDGARLTPSPIAEIEAFACQPRNALHLVEMQGPTPIEFLPKVLVGAKQAGRKPNHFYGMVLIMKRACERAGKPYAETIATDNDVTTNVVYRWVAEAKRRGITIDDDPIGTVRINGEPLKPNQPEPTIVSEPVQRVAS